MDSIYIILAIALVGIGSAFAVLYIRKYGIKNNVPTNDLEAGINVAKDEAIDQLESLKTKKPKLK